MKKLYQVTCCGKSCVSYITDTKFEDVFVVAETETEASEKALAKMRELEYNKVDDYVSEVKLIADEEETNKKLLIL